ncbi:MAG: hypothetical protein HUJ58_07735 [Erysipelotrichaceae bacterium]|nr:hypothetical protein [Erysipelotrichaceae bacterium]
MRSYIENEEYLPVVERLIAGGSFSIPEKKQIRKLGTEKKRTVYVYPREENYIFKLLTFQLVRNYDSVFSDNLFSFRIHTGVIKALKKIVSTPHISKMYSYKADISNYFNSIPVDKMLETLKKVVDSEIYQLFEDILTDSRAIDNGTIITEPKGIMAGTPFAVFLANVYLMDLDETMESYTYARYSDDIIVFADSEEELTKCVTTIKDSLSNHGLQVNPKKEVYTKPKEPWTFLGIQYCNGTVDISPVTKEKTKMKIRRRARSIKRWQIRKGRTNRQAVKAFLKAMNRKFFEASSSHELTWSRWYFPLLTTDESLHEIDLYVQQWARYLYTGKHNQSNYNFRYEDMKELGYHSLVHCWYAKDTKQQASE